MMAVFSLSMEVFAIFYDCFVAILVCTLLFGPRFAGPKQNACFAAGFLAFIGVMAWLNSHSVFEGLGGIFYSVVLFLYSLTALEGGIFQKAFFSLFWNCVMILSGFGVMLFLDLSGLYAPEEVIRYGSAGRALCLILCMVLRSLLMWLILFIGRHRQLFQERGRLRANLVWILCLLGFFLLSVTLFGVVFENVNGSLSMRFLPVLYCGLLALLAVLIVTFRQADAREQKQREREYLEKSRARQDTYIRSLSEVRQELEQLNRELDETMAAVGGLLAKAGVQEALTRLEQFDGELERFDAFAVNTANDGVNGAVTKAVQDCRRDGVRFTYRIMGSVGRFPSPDLGILLCNLLDNAREGCLKAPGDRSVDLVIVNFRGYLRCALENTVDYSLLKSNPGLKTDKRDKANHGFGLKSIQRVVELYDGVSRWETFQRESGEWVLRHELLLRFPSAGSPPV